MNTSNRKNFAFEKNNLNENKKEFFLNLISKTGIRWLEYFEIEFDKHFIELDTFFTLVIDKIKEKKEEDNLISKAKNALNEISFIFAQLEHKCLVVFDKISRMDKQLERTKTNFLNVKVENEILKKKLEENFNLIKSNELNINFTNEDFINFSKNFKNYSNARNELFHDKNFSKIFLIEENNNLRKENLFLQKYLLNLKSELFGIRLAAKYFNKELSGRVQQIQLLKKPDLNDTDQLRLWNQIETEIHLSKHKTVIKACRGRKELISGQIPDFPQKCNLHEIKRKQGICDVRHVSIYLKENEGLGISITGGKEFGIPILISEIHQNTSAARCGKLYIGDSILSVNNYDLSNVKQSEAADILLNLTGKCELECVFVISDFDDVSNEDKSTCSSKYCFFDTRILAKKNKFIDISDKSVDTLEETEEDDDDNHKSITSILNLPNKMYPGGAKPLISRIIRKKEYDFENNNTDFIERINVSKNC